MSFHKDHVQAGPLCHQTVRTHRDPQPGKRGQAEAPRQRASPRVRARGREGAGQRSREPGRSDLAGQRPIPPPGSRAPPRRARYFYLCVNSPPPPRHTQPAVAAAPRAARGSRAGTAARDPESRVPSPADQIARHGPQGPQEDPVLRARAPQPARPPSGGDGKGAAPHPRQRPNTLPGSSELWRAAGPHWPGGWGAKESVWPPRTQPGCGGSP